MPSVGGIFDDDCITTTNYKPNCDKRNICCKEHAENSKSLTDCTDGTITGPDEANGRGINDERLEKGTEIRRPSEHPPGTMGPLQAKPEFRENDLDGLVRNIFFDGPNSVGITKKCWL